jgi:hypothetical protein
MSLYGICIRAEVAVSRKIEDSMKTILLLLTMCLPSLALATSFVPKPLEEMVREADHVVVAKIVSVDMVDGRGRPLADRRSRTGPGLANQMRFNLEGTVGRVLTRLLAAS